MERRICEYAIIVNIVMIAIRFCSHISSLHQSDLLSSIGHPLVRSCLQSRKTETVCFLVRPSHTDLYYKFHRVPSFGRLVLLPTLTLCLLSKSKILNINIALLFHRLNHLLFKSVVVLNTA